MYSIYCCTVKYIKAQPLVGMPAQYSIHQICELSYMIGHGNTHLHFWNLQLDASDVGDLLYNSKLWGLWMVGSDELITWYLSGSWWQCDKETGLGGKRYRKWAAPSCSEVQGCHFLAVRAWVSRKPSGHCRGRSCPNKQKVPIEERDCGACGNLVGSPSPQDLVPSNNLSFRALGKYSFQSQLVLRGLY